MNENTGALTALATIAVAFFTFTLWLVTGDVANLSRRQIELSDRQHFLTHRPHLTVRNVRATEGEQGLVTIAFDVINIGTSEATITASSFVAEYSHMHFYAIEPPEVGNPPANVLGNVELPINGLLNGKFPIGRPFREQDLHQGTDTEGFFFGGKILYRDRSGEVRRLGFFRKMDTTTRRFRPLDQPSPDYDYDD